jgi:hypothetical protein
MKFFIFFCALIFSQIDLAKAQFSQGMRCPPGLILSYNGTGLECVRSFSASGAMSSFLPEGCFGPLPGLPSNPFANFPAPIYRPGPWWAVQGNFFYPNMSYPGPWRFPGINQSYYPGQGQVFAAKPNVYVNSVHSKKKFNFHFIPNERPSFLATTPLLSKSLNWSGTIVEGDRFEIDGTIYDYLFYDIRLPKEKMQFESGLCSSREGVIQWMLSDLREMKFPPISLQDFEEHWRVKIPHYAFYCVYPQYNSQLDPALPVEIDVEQSTFYRSLYVLVPHEKEPEVDSPSPEIPYPFKDPSEIRPSARLKREVEFREWGVAFLGY